MVQNLDDYLVGIVLGIRFRANFSIEDKLGQILDTILYSKKSYFSPEVFSTVRGEVGKKIIFNQETQDSLTIDNSNFILEINFNEDKKRGFKKSDLQGILQKFDEQIIKEVMKSFKICEIMRIGYIKRYLFPIHQLAESFVNKTVGKNLDGVNDINLRFSKKLPVVEAVIKKEVSDYDNVIFSIIKSADRDEIFMAVDYQSYFDPFLQSIDAIQFDNFINQADIFNKNKYLTWLNENYIED
ncbi:MAG: hypothetical protein PHN16_05365 [Candidatus Omnitrophica bacterium]|nr:hypothetical protein [Candidatus Omnitrophota bacterium]